MTETDAERALSRLEQLAREEQAAVEAEDVDAVCRISELLPEVTAQVLSGHYSTKSRLAERVAAIQDSHSAAERFLSLRLAETREALRLLGGGKRAASGYGRLIPQAGRVQSEL